MEKLVFLAVSCSHALFVVLAGKYCKKVLNSVFQIQAVKTCRLLQKSSCQQFTSVGCRLTYHGYLLCCMFTSGAGRCILQFSVSITDQYFTVQSYEQVKRLFWESCSVIPTLQQDVITEALWWDRNSPLKQTFSFCTHFPWTLVFYSKELYG